MTAPGDNQLKSMIEKIEALEDEKAELGRLVRDAYAEARLAGFDPKIMRRVLRCRKMKPDQFREEETLVDTYLNAVGLKGGERLVTVEQDTEPAKDDSSLSDAA
jgi:uncharacterized protein (UPF0335 family)